MHTCIFQSTQSTKKFLRFCIQGKVYQFTCLCFSPTVAPRAFTKMVTVIAAHLRMRNILLAVYLDDWFLVNLIRKVLIQDKKRTLSLLVELGFMINLKKIHTGTQSISSLHRGTFFVGKRSCLSNLGKNRKNKGSMQVDKKNTHSSKLPTFARTNGILHRTSSQCKIVHEANPVTSSAFLETINNEPTDNSSLQQTRSGTSPVLAKQRKSVEREKLLCTKLHKVSDNRCFQTRLWMSLTRSNMSGNFGLCRRPKSTSIG